MRDLAFWKHKLDVAERDLKKLLEPKGVGGLPRDPGKPPVRKRWGRRFLVRRLLWVSKLKRFKKFEHKRTKLERQIEFYKQRIEAVTTRSHRVLFAEII